ncbi:AEC family transporter [Aliihoeflea aestuarii]|jgi:malonate transporter and related proteins|uniref:AEC family transporter n=1 Tax=Aliihoeflea aestuarii TaxID=453840 RepID=UPI0020939EE0|nr:AEC family transporter [Aliihoeflea aestuarii]MCO6390352.1 AEC family transporter [Aliihoeflea aestuarii]
MIAIFESTLPIFLLIALGMALRRASIIDQKVWPGLEQLAYWFLYPALLFISIYNADFSGLQLDTMLAALLLALFLMMGLVLALWPVLRDTGLVRASEYSSVFQTATRWNGFMALAIAQKLFPPEGSAVVALVMAVIIIPLNVFSVIVVTRFANSQADWRRISMSVVLNPLILAAFLAVVLRQVPFALYGPINEALVLVASAALGMGLITIGAGLRVADMTSLRFALWLPVFLKLLVFPALLISIAWAMGLQGEQLVYLALCAAVPTAMNGYFLARQLGGDAELYAASTTIQTALSFLSMPLILALAAQLSSG